MISTPPPLPPHLDNDFNYHRQLSVSTNGTVLADSSSDEDYPPPIVLRIANPDTPPTELPLEAKTSRASSVVNRHIPDALSNPLPNMLRINTSLLSIQPNDLSIAPDNVAQNPIESFPNHESHSSVHSNTHSSVHSNTHSSVHSNTHSSESVSNGLSHPFLMIDTRNHSALFDINNLSPAWEGTPQQVQELFEEQTRHSFLSHPSSVTSSVRQQQFSKHNDAANMTHSKYSLASYFLANSAEGLKQYREMAEKSKDSDKLVYAKYLLEMAGLFETGSSRSQKIIGSRWKPCGTSKEIQRPYPYYVIPLCEQCNTTVSSQSAKDQTLSYGTPTYCSHHSHQGSFKRFTTDEFSLAQLQSPELIRNTSFSGSREKETPNSIKKKLFEEEGISIIKTLAANKEPEACYMLAHWMEQNCYGMKKNPTKSVALHLIASKDNIPESQYALGEYYANREEKKALRYYKLSAEAGYVKAIYKFSISILYGKLGLQLNLVEGLQWMYKACLYATEEFTDPLYTFACMLLNEYEQVKFPQEMLEIHGGKEAAILYLERAALLRDDRSQAMLGSIYEHGRFMESMNFSKAYKCYEAAVLCGNPKAMLGLSRLYNKGKHGPGDKDEFDRVSKDVSGWLENTPVNQEMSFYWCEKAANQELPDALSLLGWYYESGFGVPRDFKQATFYYELAAKKGQKGAITRLLDENRCITKQQHEEIAPVDRNYQHILRQRRLEKHNPCCCQ